MNGFDAWVETEQGRFALTSQRYAPDAVDPDGASRVDSFIDEPWPHWSFRLGDGTLVEQEIFVPKGSPLVALCWRIHGPRVPATLTVRPFLSGRDYHALHHENPDFRFEAELRGNRVAWRPYASVAAVTALANGGYFHEPHWYRNFLYQEERARGLDHVEDLASPGCVPLRSGPWRGGPDPRGRRDRGGSARWRSLGGSGTRVSFARSRRRGAGPSRRASSGPGMPTSSSEGRGRRSSPGTPGSPIGGRDTFIALRGLCLATGRLEEARDILLEWSHAVSEGMLPNRFPDRPEEAPEFNAVDASLWYIVAVHEYLQAAGKHARRANAASAAAARGASRAAVLAILDGYSKGTRHGIRMDADGLLAAGEPGVQLTWMDAKVGDWVVTPRIGKPVEVQALWINALRIGAAFDAKWKAVAEQAEAAFGERFWNEAGDCLYDVVDVGHRAGCGRRDLPAESDLRRRRSAFRAPPRREGAAGRRRGGSASLDARSGSAPSPTTTRPTARSTRGVRGKETAAYHQGTAWPWLLGAFALAWVAVRGGTAEARAEAYLRFVQPLLRHLDEAGLGHVSEIADAKAPHTPRGCPFQAWSVGEAIRLTRALGPASAAAREEGARA